MTDYEDYEPMSREDEDFYIEPEDGYYEEDYEDNYFGNEEEGAA